MAWTWGLGRAARLRAALVVLAVAGLCVVPAAAGAAGATSATTGSAPSTARTVSAPDGPVVLVGVPGVTWQSVTPERTPALASVGASGSMAHLSVRSVYRVTCPVDGWLTLGAGRRAAAQRVPGVDETNNLPSLNEYCPPVPPVRDGRVSDWDELTRYNEDLSFQAPLGLLGDSLAAAGLCATAVGRGAGMALAGSDGTVRRYIETPLALYDSDIDACPLTVVDAGTVNVRSDDSVARSAQVAEVEEAVAHVLAVVPADATVLLASLANAQPRATLEVVAVRGDGFPSGGVTSTSTRQPSLALLTDLTPTLFSWLGLKPSPTFVGARVTHQPGLTDFAVRRAALLTFERKVGIYTDVAQPFFTILVPAQLTLYLLAAWAIRRRYHEESGRRRTLRAAGFLAAVFAAVPVGSFLANLLPWWTWDKAGWGLVGLVMGMALSVALLAQLARSRGILGVATAVAAVTAIVLAADIILGGGLQTASLMGYSPTIAGRLYGFGNVAFALFTSAMVLVAGFLASPLVARGRHGQAVVLVGVLGVAAVVLDGLPSLGSDFGGVLAIIPAFGVLLLAAAGLRLTLTRVVAWGAIGLGVVMAIAVVDWLRPADEQSHMGRFVQQILDGEVLDIISRKLGNNLNVLTSSVLGLLVPFAVAFVVFVLLRATPWRGAVLQQAQTMAPMLRPTLTAWAVGMFVGFAVNDSGVAIPAVGIMLVMPLMIVISSEVLQHVPPTSGARDAPVDREEPAAPA